MQVARVPSLVSRVRSLPHAGSDGGSSMFFLPFSRVEEPTRNLVCALSLGIVVALRCMCEKFLLDCLLGPLVVRLRSFTRNLWFLGASFCELQTVAKNIG